LQGSVFLPYFSLLQLDQLASPSSQVESFVLGCSNSVLLQQKRMRTEVSVNLINGTIEYLDHSDFFEQLLYLTAADYQFISHVVEMVEKTWQEGGQHI